MAKLSILPVISRLWQRPRAPRAGLTLIEILFVMAVLAVMVALVISLGRHADETTRIHQARTDLGQWHEALGRWHDAMGEYPRPPTAINVAWLVTNEVYVARFIAATEKTRYTDEGAESNVVRGLTFFYDLPLRDPWRQFYRYEAADDTTTGDTPPLLEYNLYSAGPDGNPDEVHDNIYFTN